MSNEIRKVRLDGPSRRPPQWAPQPVVPSGNPTTPAPVFTYTKPKKRFNFNKRQIALIGGGLLATVGLFLVVKAVLASHKIITRNASGSAPALAGDVDPTKLKGEGDGRVNILVMGIGGAGHDGGNLSDTMVVVSIDPRTKDVAMLSLPRDLYVPIPGYGTTKINAANAYGEAYKYPGGGGALAKTTVSKVLDIPIHYYIRVDFGAFKQAVDSVGGVDINVAQSLYDPEYPCDNNQARECGFSLSAGQKHMDGTLALKYVRCRKGNCGNDFGRAARQQQVMLALREKALSLQTLSNPAKLSGLIDAIGDHVKTDLQPNEIKKLAEIARQINPNGIVNKVLDESSNLVTTDMVDGASVVVPTAGIGNFTDIRAFVHGLFIDSYLKDESASVEVQNGTTRSGLANTVATLLKSYGYNVTKTATAPNQKYPATVIYDYTGGKKPYTIHYLETRFNAKAQKANPGPDDSTDIKVIIGANYRSSGN
ncbi:MAG TPA: LCP family protein [Candidatus Nanoarchaeia archaeon]|nr:LCP family protein [Candidatus Nanoarchaeia archaeon]